MVLKRGVYPTDKQVCQALLVAIATHPKVQESNILYPDSREGKVKIENYRLFGGIELIEPGLTLAVYPAHAALDQKTGAISPTSRQKSIFYPDTGMKNVMGRANTDTYGTHAIFSLVVQLYYRDATFNQPTNLSYDIQDLNDYDKLFAQNHHPQYTDKSINNVLSLEERSTGFTKKSKLEVKILPGEEVLRDWNTLVRGVIRDIPILLPFPVRHPTIVAADYPTSNWIKQSENLVFHTAYTVVQYDLSEPANLDDYNLPLVQTIDIEA